MRGCQININNADVAAAAPRCINSLSDVESMALGHRRPRRTLRFFFFLLNYLLRSCIIYTVCAPSGKWHVRAHGRRRDRGAESEREKGGSERAGCPPVSRPSVLVSYCFRHRSRACLARFLRPRQMSLVRSRNRAWRENEIIRLNGFLRVSDVRYGVTSERLEIPDKFADIF